MAELSELSLTHRKPKNGQKAGSGRESHLHIGQEVRRPFTAGEWGVAEQDFTDICTGFWKEISSRELRDEGWRGSGNCGASWSGCRRYIV